MLQEKEGISGKDTLFYFFSDGSMPEAVFFVIGIAVSRGAYYFKCDIILT